MGEVWRALDPALRRHVAIKVLPEEFSRDPDRLRRFTQEAQAVGILNHPNVLAIDQATSLWRISVGADTGTVSGAAAKLSSGTSEETKPSVTAAGRVAFASLKQDLNI